MELRSEQEFRQDVSVIIPVYNVEKLLPRCVDSIIGQDKKELEIILVDDGATDASGEICDAYAEKDARIRVIHKPNGGLTSAWKAGLAEAHGAYVGFVDSDDWVDPDMYSRMYEKAVSEDADVVVCGLVFDFEDPNVPKRNEISAFAKETYERADLEALFPTLINDGHFFGRTIQPARVTKLYRREILEANVSYCSDKVSVGEDMQITLPVLMDTRKLSVVKEFYPYHYWINSASMTGRHDKNYLTKIKILSESLKRIVDAEGVYDFKPQIINDFLSLTILAVKNEICRNYKAGRKEVVGNVKEICEDPEVREALAKHTMDKLSISVKLYIYLMKKGHYNLCYALVLVFFKLQYLLHKGK